MAKTSGLGQQFYIAGYDLSGDVGSLSNVHGGQSPLDVTAINKYAHERIGGPHDASLDFVAWYNPASGQEHAALSTLPTGDVDIIYSMGAAIGSPAFCLRAKQINYDPTRGADGSLSFAVHADSNGYGGEWGNLLTAGLRTDTGATDGASLDGLAATTTGWSAYLQVTSITGTSVTVALEDSANNSAWLAVSGGAFAAASALGTQRIAGASGATLRRYVRAVTTGTFNPGTFAVAVSRHPYGAAT